MIFPLAVLLLLPRDPHPAILSRVAAQDGGAWVIDYRLRLTGGDNVIPAAVQATVDGWVSNSRVPGHAAPRHTTLQLLNGPNVAATCPVIKDSTHGSWCSEKLSCRVQPVTAAVVDVRLRLEHAHEVYGTYDPLLGVRTVELRVAGSVFRDVVPLDREVAPAQSRATWPEPPEERRDTRQFMSAPDSLHLEAHVPGHHYYRYPDRPVRYGTRMRLKFWYLIARGTEGEVRFRVAQYKDTPKSWHMLAEAGLDKPLAVVGRWTRVEQVFATDAEATMLTLDFRISGEADIGEVWIDDVSLEPVVCPVRGGP